MARPPIASVWRWRILTIAANDPGLTPTAIARQLDTPDEMAAVGREDPPHRSTIQRVLQEVSADELTLHRYVRWPDSFGSPDLPWEAAPAVLELSAQYRGFENRPTVRVANWYWRLCASAPGIPTDLAGATARALAASEAAHGKIPDALRSSVEDWLMFRPWTDEGAERYRELTKWKRVSPWDPAEPFVPPAGAALGQVAEALVHFSVNPWGADRDDLEETYRLMEESASTGAEAEVGEKDE